MKKIVNGILVELTAEQAATLASELNQVHPERYKELRANSYPQFTEYLDAQVKKASSDPSLVAEGLQQEADYLAACLAVKAQFPKPEVLNE